MEIIGKKVLEKLKRKNKGNTELQNAVDNLIRDLENNAFQTQEELKKIRPDADAVHSDGFYFFNLSIHRTLILIEFEEDGEATIIWAGSHDKYEETFQNNKNTIRKWLKDREWIN
ncbi:hypothetical protein Fleli_2495 [Bernardetia litoralis DSM 6794]|uniref:Addiction module toxin RelE n=1 Tax=Bernardetia litoralis (strain ATCC 23117 / DSM 6794 / NBRC 15988 / NCIMB 1366 / Fx l1 / Sio-4) TaxID=880071 RepID=I4ALM5_BERLS|nr:type II toxin-antitoxin system HigB family toxin [Bernardetia litoralis]AFM04860.1 hypothetical protein Fleli_2495 [Bernardetia litoralis DSM 6794]